MSEIRKLFKQSSHYVVGQALVMVAGLISFPILTRILSVSDYGLLGLISVTIFIVQAVAKLGAPSAIVRFYAEFRSSNRLPTFHSTVFFGYGTLALIISIIFLLLVRLASGKLLDPHICNLLSLVSILVFLNCLVATMTSTLRAEQKTGMYNCTIIIRRYGALAFSILLLVLYAKNLYAYYFGHIVSALIICSVLLAFFFRTRRIKFRSFSPRLFKASLKFGSPLMWSELGHLILGYSDRYLIQHYLGSAPLGLYIAGYNLTTYATDIIMYPINYALDPIYLRIFSNKGEEETKIFLSKALRYFFLILSPVVFGVIAVGKDLIAVLASSKYASAHIIIPYVITGNAIYACQVILNAGLVIVRKTHILMIVKIGSCILNIGLNIFLIPRYGIIGAAQATLFSYIFYTIVITHYSFKELRFRIDYPRILLYLVVAATMYLAINFVDVGSPFGNLVTKIPAGAIFYAVLILVLDRDVRNAVRRTITGSVILKPKDQSLHK